MSVYAQPYAMTAAGVSKPPGKTPPKAGGGSGNPPTGVSGGTAQPPVIPPRPTDPTGTDPIATPYDADQPLAQKAYDDAIAQIGQSEQSTYANYGVSVDPLTGAATELDPAASPYGLFQQQQRQAAMTSDQLHASTHSRGFFGGGLEGQAEDAGQLAAGQGALQNYTGLINAETGFKTARTQAGADLSTRLLNDATQGATWLQQQQLFTPAAPTRTDANVTQIVSKAAAAWKAKYGSLDKPNKAGQTFQQRLDFYGAKLYDPSLTYMFAGQEFGG